MIALVLVLLVAATGAQPPRTPGGVLFHKGLANSVDEVFGSYFAPERKNEIDRPYPHFLHKLLEDTRHNLVEPRRVERTAYFHVQTRQKDKRYASYLTLCHFKICNMGRKRTTRYFHVISALDNGT